jgi:hypothetical protein
MHNPPEFFLSGEHSVGENVLATQQLIGLPAQQIKTVLNSNFPPIVELGNNDSKFYVIIRFSFRHFCYNLCNHSLCYPDM